MTITVPSRGWLIVIFVSLAANLVLAGVMIGRSGARYFGHHDAPPHERPRGGDREFFREMREIAPMMRQHHEQIHAARERLNGLLGVEQPDRAEIDKELDFIRESTAEMQGLAQTRFIDSLLEMPLEQRRERLEKMSRKGRGDLRLPGDMPPPPRP